jgi:hypothetical protein
MHNLVLVKVVNAKENLLEYFKGLGLIKLLPLFELNEKLLAFY